jgi:hypothetical protein
MSDVKFRNYTGLDYKGVPIPAPLVDMSQAMVNTDTWPVEEEPETLDTAQSIIWIYTQTQYESFTCMSTFVSAKKLSPGLNVPDDCLGMWQSHFICAANMSVIDWYVNEMEYLKQQIAELEEKNSIFENTQPFEMEDSF